MLLTEQTALAFAAVTLGTQLALRSQVFYRAGLFRRLLKYAAALAAVVIFGIVGYWTFELYSNWSAHPFFINFLPPATPITYFLNYVGSRLVYPYFITLAAAALVACAMRAANRRFENRFFEDEEPLLAAFAVFLAGYPGFLLYIPIVLVFGAAETAAYAFLKKGRAPLYYLWLPSAIIVILISNFLLPPSFEMFFRL